MMSKQEHLAEQNRTRYPYCVKIQKVRKLGLMAEIKEWLHDSYSGVGWRIDNLGNGYSLNYDESSYLLQTQDEKIITMLLLRWQGQGCDITVGNESLQRHWQFVAKYRF